VPNKDKYKIFHLISSLKRGGRERQLATITANTDHEKFPTKIVYLNDSEKNYLDEYNLSEFVFKIRSRNNFFRLLELHRLIDREKPDIIYSWGNFESVLVLLLKPFHGFKFINGSVRHGIRSKKLSHYFRTFVLHLSQNVVSNSFAGLKANNLKRGTVLYNGISNKFINKLSIDEKRKLRKAMFGIEGDKVLLISVANLVPYKDYFSIIEALVQLNADGVRFHYLILGDGPLRSKIEEKIREKDLQNMISIMGNVPNVQQLLQISDIFIHSSKGEGCSNAILEAMASGLPIIASNTGGTPEIVTNENGYLFEYQNHNELTKAILDLLSDKEKINAFGERSQQIVKNDFTIEHMIQNYYMLIEELGAIQTN